MAVFDEKINSIRLVLGVTKHIMRQMRDLQHAFITAGIMRRTQASEYYLCLKCGQTSAVYSVMSDRASSPTAETAKKCKMTHTNADGGRLKICLTPYAIVQYMPTYFN